MGHGRDWSHVTYAPPKLSYAKVIVHGRSQNGVAREERRDRVVGDSPQISKHWKNPDSQRCLSLLSIFGP